MSVAAGERRWAARKLEGKANLPSSVGVGRRLAC